MENPETWGKAERIVQDVLYLDHKNKQNPPELRLTGWSLAKRITEALKTAGLLKEEE